MVLYSPEYVEHLSQGPFPGRIDPWGEAGYFFKQLHSTMIGILLGELQKQLLPRGYIVGRESSLQISGGPEPDIFVRRSPRRTETMSLYEYAAAAAALSLEVGDEAFDEYKLGALHIRDLETGNLLTVLEIISPSNKDQYAIRYRQYRAFLLSEGVNFVEIDATRSVQRLLETQLTRTYPYHSAVYLPGETPLVLGNEFEQHLKDFALPLRHEVLPVATQNVFDRAYQTSGIAAHIEHHERYIREELPFPSTLTHQQIEQSLNQVYDWLKKLRQLRQQPIQD